MSITITPATKNTLTITNQVKDSSTTWDQATYTWDEAVGTWDVPGFVLSQPSKNTLTITNQVKL